MLWFWKTLWTHDIEGQHDQAGDWKTVLCPRLRFMVRVEGEGEGEGEGGGEGEGEGEGGGEREVEGEGDGEGDGGGDGDGEDGGEMLSAGVHSLPLTLSLFLTLIPNTNNPMSLT
jgi:hypothetical protein